MPRAKGKQTVVTLTDVRRDAAKVMASASAKGSVVVQDAKGATCLTIVVHTKAVKHDVDA